LVPKESGKATPALTPREPSWSDRASETFWAMLRSAIVISAGLTGVVTIVSMKLLFDIPRMKLSS